MESKVEISQISVKYLMDSTDYNEVFDWEELSEGFWLFVKCRFQKFYKNESKRHETNKRS